MPETTEGAPPDGGEADLAELATGPGSIVRVASQRSTAGSHSNVQIPTNARAGDGCATDDQSFSRSEVQAMLAEVGLTLEVKSTGALYARRMRPAAPPSDDVWARNAALVDRYGV